MKAIVTPTRIPLRHGKHWLCETYQTLILNACLIFQNLGTMKNLLRSGIAITRLLIDLKRLPRSEHTATLTAELAT